MNLLLGRRLPSSTGLMRQCNGRKAPNISRTPTAANGRVVGAVRTGGCRLGQYTALANCMVAPRRSRFAGEGGDFWGFYEALFRYQHPTPPLGSHL